MPPSPFASSNRHRILVGVTILQFICGIYFIYDALSELVDHEGSPFQGFAELVVVVALMLGSALGVSEIRRLLQRNDNMTDRMRVASGAFVELLEDSFLRWGLTQAERDVALLSIKGLSIAEIAGLRASREGTVKAQSTAVYRKAGVSGRAQLISLFVEDLMAGTVLTPAKAAE